MEKRPHMEPGACPGQSFFERKEAEHYEQLRTIVTEAIGDVPKYMRIAGENRIWLWVLSVGLIMTGIILLIL